MRVLHDRTFYSARRTRLWGKILAGLILLLSFAVLGQKNVSGRIVAMDSGIGLEGATIALSDRYVTVSDANGQFNFKNIDSASYTLHIKFVGYEPLYKKIDATDANAFPDFVMTPSVTRLNDVTVTSEDDNPLKTLSSIDIKMRMIRSSQDILRLVPGLFIAQHAGGGKAEQIFLRGFDVDHGTDINLEVDGLPVNMVSHAHGQGYADLHFVIPELVAAVDFDKGPYNGAKGNFATAGYVSFRTKRKLDRNLAKVEGGSFGNLRTVMAIALPAKRKEKSFGYVATEFLGARGYFESPQSLRRLNLASRYSYTIGKKDNLEFSASHFTSTWNASGQIPERAVKKGMITRFGAIDDSEGGSTERSNLAVKHIHSFGDGSMLQQQVYGTRYNFNLYSNFTFFLNDRNNGDQINQKEARRIFGYNLTYFREHMLGSKSLSTEAGGSIRYDHIPDISLSNTLRRTFVSLNNRAMIREAATNVYISETVKFSPEWTINGAIRLDHLDFENSDKISLSRTRTSATILSPKMTIRYQPNSNMEYYVRTGSGFHSNDTRAILNKNVRITLPRAYGMDVGVNAKLGARAFLNAALWSLDMQQELIYVGDEGVVEPGGRTQRRGFEMSMRYEPLSWLMTDVNLEVIHARAKGDDSLGKYIPLAPAFTSSGGFTTRFSKLNGNVRFRYLADRPANELNTLTARGYYLMDAAINFRSEKIEFEILAENIFNVDWKEAQFETESRLLDEDDPITDIHYTPGSPFFIKVAFSLFF